ncbi:MAG: hypothetical protein OXC31_15165 [Spirochaetaceae bacterium]|nr:hypothetical protein [Spirochaetaceae bacterium]
MAEPVAASPTGDSPGPGSTPALPGYPDLEVSASVSDNSPAAGAAFALSATVRNEGDESAAATTLRWYRSADVTVTTSDTSVGTEAVEGLAAFGSRGTSLALTAPETAGTYYYGACVDAVAAESDTRNNCSASVTVRVRAPSTDTSTDTTVPEPEGDPDLVVASVTVSDSEPSGGGTFTLSATVRNDGTAAAAATTLRYYRSADENVTTSDTEVGDDATVGLASSGSVSASADLTAPEAAGTYYYGACVDAVEDESDTANNCSTSVSIEVKDSSGGFTLGPKPINLGPNSDYQPNEDGWHIGTDGVDVLLIPDGIDAKVDVRGGDDRVFGGDGDDHFVGGDDNDLLAGGPGDDYLVGGEGDDSLSGNDGADHLVGGEGDDRLIDDGSETSDRLEGGPGDDYIGGNAGIDDLYGGPDDDHLNDPFGANEIRGGPGNDRLYGTGKLYGEEGDDYLQSSSESGNELYGGAGRDRLWAGSGSPTFLGGTNIDSFDFNYPGSATVTIKDFSPGEDFIDLATLFRIPGFDDLTITASGDDVVIGLTEHYSGTIRLENVAVDDLDAEDFRF